MDEEIIEIIEKPVFDRTPDFINEIGTRFWTVNDFDDLINQCSIDVSISFSDYTDEDGNEFWGYLIIEDGTVMFESVRYENIKEILESVLEESIERGLISFEQE